MRMTYGEFLAEVKELDIYLSNKRCIGDDPYSSSNETPDVPDYCFMGQGIVSGVSGGSCWDNSNPQPFYDEGGKETAKKEYEKTLDKIVVGLCPQITFMEYKKIADKVEKTDEYTAYEYYGNKTNYFSYYCILQELYDALVKEGLL